MNTEPVSIEINLKHNVDTEGAKATQAMDNLAAATIQQRKEVEANLKLQSEYVAKLRKELNDLNAQYNKLDSKQNKTKTDYSARNEVARVIMTLNKELNDEEKGLKSLKEEYMRLKKAQDDIVSSSMRVKKEMIALKRAGLEQSDEYQNLVGELKSLAQAHAEVNKEQQLLAKGSGSVFTAMLEGLQGLAGALTAVAGTMGLLGAENKEYEEIQTRLQALMAITIGLQQTHNLFLSTSAVRMKATTLATKMWTAAHTKLATAMGITAIQAKILTGVLTGGVAILIGVAIAAIDSFLTKLNSAKKQEEEIRKSTAENSSQQIALLQKLRIEYNSLGDDAQKKKKFIEENAEEIEKTGYAVNTLAEADALFVSGTADFIDAIKQKAIAAATMEVAAEKYKEAVELMMKAEKRAAEPSFLDKVNAKINNAQSNTNKRDATYYAKISAGVFLENATKLWEEGDKLIERGIEESKKVEAPEKKYNVNSVNKQKQEKAEKEKAEEARRKAEEKAKARDGAEKKLASMTLSNQRQIDAAIVAAMKEGAAKKLKQIELEHRQKIDAIEAQYKEIEQIEKAHGVNAAAQKDQLKKLQTELEKYRTDQIDNVTEDSARAINRILTESSDEMRPRHDKELEEVRTHYAALIDEAKKYAKDDEELARVTDRLENDRKNKELLTRREHELEILDFENEISRMRGDLRSRDIASDTDREELRLSVEIEAAEKRLEKLLQIKEAGGEADKDIALSIEQIKILKRELQDIPVKRIKEIGREIKGVFSSLSGLGGEVGQVFGSLANGVDDIMVMFDKGVGTMDRISAGLKGLVELYNIGAEQAKKNEEAEKKWADAIIATARRATLARIETLKHVDSNIWGVGNPYANAIAGAQQYREAMMSLNASIRELNEGQIQTGTKRVVSGGNIAKGVASGAAAGAAIGSIIPGLGTALGAGIGAALGGLFGAVKTKVVPVFDDLKSRFGSILKEGTETFELNPEILNNYDRLDDATKKLVDNWQEIQKKAIEAQESINNTFKGLTGDLGNALSKSLMEGFMSRDIQVGMDNFEAELDKMIGRIVEQMLFASYFEEQFKELQDSMKASFDQGGDGTIVDDLKTFKKAYSENAKLFYEALKEADKELQEDGIRAWEQERKSVAGKGLAQASQDSIDEVVGLQTNMLMQLRILVELKTSEIRAHEERDSLIRSIAINVAKIAEDTGFLNRLEGIAADIAALKRDGITLKK